MSDERLERMVGTTALDVFESTITKRDGSTGDRQMAYLLGVHSLVVDEWFRRNEDCIDAAVEADRLHP